MASVATSVTSASGTSGAGRRPIASRTLARVAASWLYTTTFMAQDGTDWGVGLRTPTRCRNNGPVVTASREVAPPRGVTSRPNLVSVGTIIWLSSELMFFAALFAMYFTIRSVDKGMGQPWPQANLDLTLASINTTVLLLSSVTCQLGVFAVERGQIRRTGSVFNMARWGLREWYVLSFV